MVFSDCDDREPEKGQPYSNRKIRAKFMSKTLFDIRFM